MIQPNLPRKSLYGFDRGLQNQQKRVGLHGLLGSSREHKQTQFSDQGKKNQSKF